MSVTPLSIRRRADNASARCKEGAHARYMRPLWNDDIHCRERRRWRFIKGHSLPYLFLESGQRDGALQARAAIQAFARALPYLREAALTRYTAGRCADASIQAAPHVRPGA